MTATEAPPPGDGKPCAGLSVVEVAIGVSDLGLGMAGGVPGMMLADLGADVTRVVGTSRPAIDRQVPWGQVWHRDKRVVISDDPDYVRGLLRGADVALVYGPESLVEERGLGYLDRHRDNPGLVYARCRPSRTGRGTVADWGLLVEADAGFCTQLAGHRPGPIFVDVRASAAGTAFLLTTSVLALLRRRVLTGAGGWAETSLYDGMLATLGCMIGRSERAPAEVEGYWAKGSTFPNFLYRCADDELIQVWFGGKGMYAKLIDVLGDEPSTEGYYVDQSKGMLGVRAQRWKATFATQPRDVWIERLRAVGVACEPVLGPGDVLSDPHVTETGLAATRQTDAHTDLTVTTPITITPVEPDGSVTEMWGPGTTSRSQNGSGLLAGVRVLDFSAFVAGPLAAEVLADMGADVIKVEPPEGEAMRGAAYAIAACQRGKRSLAMDLTAPDARPVVERLIRWADVVLHNFRVGVSERLGIDEATVAQLNPDAVYCHASAFGTPGPRAKAPGNDALMQALTGFERANGGAGNDPIAGTWIPLDMAGGWVAAAGILAGLYGKESDGRGRQVATSLLGAAMLLHGGVFQRDGEVVRGPELDGAQTGYGPGYRLYEAGDGGWFALVLPDPDAWQRLRALLGADGADPRSVMAPKRGAGAPDLGARTVDLPVEYVPLRGGIDDVAARRAEAVLQEVFTSASRDCWVEWLRRAGLLVESVEAADRDAFRRGILDDPVNRQLGRVASYGTVDWGDFEQIGPLLRCGPGVASGPPRLMLPRVGEHSSEVLTELGFEPAEVDRFLDAKIIRQL